MFGSLFFLNLHTTRALQINIKEILQIVHTRMCVTQVCLHVVTKIQKLMENVRIKKEFFPIYFY